jgi:microcystin-dependent protein
MASDPFIGEIRMYGGTTPPPGWNFCDGTTLSINSNVELYQVLGTTFGGTSSTFNLPDLRGRFVVSTDGNEYLPGQSGGAEQVSLLDVNLPAHSHPVNCSSTGGSDTPKSNTWGLADESVYSPPATGALAKAMSAMGITSAGTGKPHENMIPYQCVNYIIALDGLYPGGGAQDQYLSEIRIFPYSFVPDGWLNCNGEALPVSANQALYSLLGNTFGGDGTNFNIPYLFGRVAMHAGQVHTLGESGGEAGHVLTVSEMPAHNHQAQASSSGPAVGLPTNAFWATNTGVKPYGGPAVPLMAPQALNTAGGNVPHENRSPYLVISFCISITGIYPSKN